MVTAANAFVRNLHPLVYQVRKQDTNLTYLCDRICFKFFENDCDGAFGLLKPQELILWGQHYNVSGICFLLIISGQKVRVDGEEMVSEESLGSHNKSVCERQITEQVLGGPALYPPRSSQGRNYSTYRWFPPILCLSSQKTDCPGV